MGRRKITAHTLHFRAPSSLMLARLTRAAPRWPPLLRGLKAAGVSALMGACFAGGTCTGAYLCASMMDASFDSKHQLEYIEKLRNAMHDVDAQHSGTCCCRSTMRFHTAVQAALWSWRSFVGAQKTGQYRRGTSRTWRVNAAKHTLSWLLSPVSSARGSCGS